jgi:hypothetical protein
MSATILDGAAVAAAIRAPDWSETTPLMAPVETSCPNSFNSKTQAHEITANQIRNSKRRQNIHYSGQQFADCLHRSFNRVS